jgi:ABC-2 type transport system permease protein
MIRLFTADLKMLVRNKQLIFWSFAFPLIFTVIFGFFFGGKGANFGTALFVDQAHTQLSQTLYDVMAKQPALTVKYASSAADAQSQMKGGKAAGAVIVPPGFGVWPPSEPVQVTVFYDPGSASGRAAIDGIVGGFVTQVSFRAQHVQPLYTTDDIAIGGASHNYFDYVLIGLLGMALMNSAIQGLAISMSRYRENRILKRIAITPLPQWKFMLAEILARLVINVAQVVVILAVGVYAFHAAINAGAIWPLLGLAIVGAVLFQLVGFSIAAVTKTTDAAQGMAQAITIPMMFLAGVFFSTDGLPNWLRLIVQFLPLAPLLRMMRGVALDNHNIADPPSNIYIVVAWIVVLALVVRSRFKLGEEYNMHS